MAPIGRFDMKCVSCSKEVGETRVGQYPACEECYRDHRLYDWFKEHDPSMIILSTDSLGISNARSEPDALKGGPMIEPEQLREIIFKCRAVLTPEEVIFLNNLVTRVIQSELKEQMNAGMMQEMMKQLDKPDTGV